ncbi:MAG: choice-of-anchor Q domain-containing protein, partial [Anaerolineales bacterium]
AALGPPGAAQAAPRAAQAPSAPAGGTVGSGLGTCDEAALTNALAGGGTLTFNCGGPATILITSQKYISQATTINGGGIITITGGLATRLFQVDASASLALRDIVLDSGFSNGASGGAIANAGTLSLERTTIQYSQTDAGHAGGAIFTSGPTTIIDSQFTENSAAVGGALLAIGARAQVAIYTSTFDHNHVTPTNGHGGAIAVNPGASVSIHNSTVSYNDSAGDGGGVYNQGSFASEGTAYIYNTTTQDPNASFRGYGGGIASLGALSLLNDVFLQNFSRYGGGLFVGGTADPAAAQLSGVQFVQNRAVFGGGGLYTSADNTSLSIFESIFQGNQADVGGGLSRNTTGLTITRSAIGENIATRGGGLLSSASPGPGTEVRVYDSTFYSNVVTMTEGGAILNQGLMDLRNLTLEGNTTGVFNSGSGEVMKMANTVLHNVGLNCDGDGTKPQSQGGNFSDDVTCALAASGDSQGIGLDPLLSEIEITFDLFVTKSFMPLPGSPLINTAQVACSPVDQRRAVRPDHCDKGAVEYGGLPPRLYLPLLRRNP